MLNVPGKTSSLPEQIKKYNLLITNNSNKKAKLFFNLKCCIAVVFESVECVGMTERGGSNYSPIFCFRLLETTQK